MRPLCRHIHCHLCPSQKQIDLLAYDVLPQPFSSPFAICPKVLQGVHGRPQISFSFLYTCLWTFQSPRLQQNWIIFSQCQYYSSMGISPKLRSLSVTIPSIAFSFSSFFKTSVKVRSSVSPRNQKSPKLSVFTLNV